MRSKKGKKCILALIVLALVLGSSISGFGVPSFSDTSGHWAEDTINDAAALGFIQGYENGTFRPDSPVTRAEFSRMLNVVLEVTDQASIGFRDVRTSEWYYAEVRKAVSAGFISGYEDNTFRPGSSITRQEAAVMMSKVLPPVTSSLSLSSFKDNSSISSWARTAVTAVFTAGYMQGDDQGRFRPLGSLTRAEAATILVKYAENETIVTADTKVTSSTTLRDRIYVNDVTIDKSLGDSDLSIDGCLILGTLHVNGGGESTITLKNTLARSMIMAKTTGDVRVLLTGYSAVNEASLLYGGILEQSSLKGAGFKVVNLEGSALRTQEVGLAGNFTNVVLASRSVLEQLWGNIDTLTINASAAGSSVKMNSGTTIDTAIVNGETAFTGTGKISTMKANANDITYETRPSVITVASGVTRKPTLSEDTSPPQPSFTPTDGATGVLANTKITIVFDEPIRKSNGGTVSTLSDIRNIVELWEMNSTGSSKVTEIAYTTATISSDKRTIIITPATTLNTSKYHDIIILAGTIEDENGYENEKITSSFKTGTQDVAAPVPTFSPAGNATNADVAANIRITFDEVIYDAAGGTTTNSDISSMVELRTGSSTGTKVSFSGTIDSAKKVITLDPVFDLTLNTDYYVILLSGSIEDASGNAISKITSTFRTGLVTVAPVITTDPTVVSALPNNSTVVVTLSSATAGSTIYYTLNGSTPSPASTQYTSPFEVSTLNITGETVVVKAIAVKPGMTNSEVTSKSIVFTSNQVTTPIIGTKPNDVSAISSSDTVQVTITTGTAGASVYYTTDGSTPTAASTLYTGGFSVGTSNSNGETIVVKAIATKLGMGDSPVASKNIVFVSNQAAAPTFLTDPASTGALPNNASVRITIQSDTNGANIYFTANGDTPSSASTLYTGSFNLTTSSTLGEIRLVKAIAIKPGMSDSPVTSISLVFLPQ